MNSNVENKSYMQQNSSIDNNNLLMKKINATVNINEKLKRRTRNGGFIAWPKAQGQTQPSGS